MPRRRTPDDDYDELDYDEKAELDEADRAARMNYEGDQDRDEDRC